MASETDQYYLKRGGPPVSTTVGELKLVTGYKLAAGTAVQEYDDPDSAPHAYALPAGTSFYLDAIRAPLESSEEASLESAADGYRFMYLADDADNPGIRVLNSQTLAVLSPESTPGL